MAKKKEPLEKVHQEALLNMTVRMKKTMSIPSLKMNSADIQAK